MDDSSKDIKRDELLKLGGIGALAAIAALVAEAVPAEADNAYGTAKPKPKPTADFGNNPIGLDLLLKAPGGVKKKRANSVAATKVIVTGDITKTVGAKVVYTITNPSMAANLPNGDNQDSPDLKGTAYVAVWY